MKSSIATTLTALALFTASAASLAVEEVQVTGAAPGNRGTTDQQAVGACFDAFIQKILPGSTSRVRVVMPGGSDQRLGVAVPAIMVSMKATEADSHVVLATGDCTVTSTIKVTSLPTTVLEPAKLAKLSLKDISLAAKR